MMSQAPPRARGGQGGHAGPSHPRPPAERGSRHGGCEARRPGCLPDCAATVHVSKNIHRVENPRSRNVIVCDFPFI